MPAVRWEWLLPNIALHVSAAFAPWHFSWSGALLGAVLLWMTGGLGISMGWHRLNTHRSFRTSLPLQRFLTLLGTLAWQGGPIEWTGIHRRHHADTEVPTVDPHSPREGTYWSHFGWITRKQRFDPLPLAADLARDPLMRWCERYNLACASAVFVLLYAAGELTGSLGLSWMLWAGSVRSVALLHITWMVNSVGHRWGYRNFATGDDSTNVPWLAYMSFGEGWHNNHHAQPRSAAHGMFAGEFDVTYTTLRLLERAGLVWNLVEPNVHPRFLGENASRQPRRSGPIGSA